MTSFAARADTLTDFTLNATLTNGGTENGTLTLDRTTNQFSSGNITVFSGGITYLLQLDGQAENNGTYFTTFSDSLNNSANVNLPALSTLAGYQGGQIAYINYYGGVSSEFVKPGPPDPSTCKPVRFCRPLQPPLLPSPPALPCSAPASWACSA